MKKGSRTLIRDFGRRLQSLWNQEGFAKTWDEGFRRVSKLCSKTWG